MSDEILSTLNVSRETMERLNHYVALLKTWNAKINLVSPNTLSEVWTRHILDSAQLYSTAKLESGIWVDIGSGGGFPGLVIAILADDSATGQETVLIESDQRKCTFLRTVAREVDVPVRVIAERIEAVEPLFADVVSARALAPLETLIGYVNRHIAPNGKALLPKGARWKQEVESARKTWNFEIETHRSLTSPDAVILEIGEITHV